MGFEPTYDGFANHCLTAWLPHRRGARTCHAVWGRSSGERGAPPGSRRVASRRGTPRPPPEPEARAPDSDDGTTRRCAPAHAAPSALGHPNVTSTWTRVPAGAIGTTVPSIRRPSTSSAVTPLQTPRGFRTRMMYSAPRKTLLAV